MNALSKDFAAQLNEVERHMLAMPQLPFEIIHRFGPGLYIREATMPAGSFVIGHHHKTEHLNIMLTGRMTLITGDGEVRELTAPYMYTAPPGRKAAHIHEDVTWLNIHATNETDIEKLEDELLFKSEEWHAAQPAALEYKLESV